MGKKHKKRSVGFITLWDEYLTALIKKNDSNYGEIRNRNMYVDLLGTYSGYDNVSYYYTIDSYPTELENSYRTTLRGECLFGVHISFISQFDKYSIEWNSARIRARLRNWKISETDDGDVDEYNLHSNLQQLDTQDWRKDSLVYLSTADIRRKRKMFKFRSMMIISGKRGTDFNRSVVAVTNLMQSMGIHFTRITGDIPLYLRTFSPFMNQYNASVFDNTGVVALPDELLARFNTYSQGMVGRDGIYWGTDIYSCFPCLKMVKQTTESTENWLITAESGGGKSFFCKGLLVQLCADDKFNGTIMDIEGFEYIPLANYLSRNSNVVVINMAEGSGAYFDPVEIIVTGDEELDRDMYGLSISFTISMFKCLIGDIQEEDEWTEIVINDAISLAYAGKGVDSARFETWELSKGMTIYDVYSTLKSLKMGVNADSTRAVGAYFARSMYEEHLGINKSLTQNDVNRLILSNEGYQKAIDMCIAKVSRYFEDNGVRSNMFRNRIKAEDVRDSKLVICSFGMAGKSESSVDATQMALMQLYAANISHLRSIFSKQAGKFNFKLWEEFQRWGGFPDADKTINVALTGGRKLGDVNIIVTNKVVEMLDNDRFGVFSNLTSIAIGAIGDSKVREDLCTRLSIPGMLQELDKIADNNKDLSAYIKGDTLLDNPYKKSFLIGLDRTVYTIARMSISEGLAKSNIFRTGINLNGDT